MANTTGSEIVAFDIKENVETQIQGEVIVRDRKIFKESGFNLYVPKNEDFDEGVSNCYISDVTLNHGFVEGFNLHDQKNEGFEEALKSLESRLKRQYASNWLRRLPWMEPIPFSDHYINLSMCERNGVGRIVKDKIQNEQIFLPSKKNHVPPKTILILGDAGFGKSTFLTKIAYDWSTKIGLPVNEFKLVILCRLCDLPPGVDLEEHILALCSEALQAELVCGESVRDILRPSREKLLVILDGYDELSEEQRASARRILSGDSFFNRSTIVVSSRPCNQERNFRCLFDRFLRILPLNEESQELLVNRMFYNDLEKASVVNRFVKESKLSNLSSLLLFSICFAYENKIEDKFCGSDLLFDVARIIFRRERVREHGDILPDEMSLNEIFFRLGKFFLECLRNRQLTFKTQELMEAMQCDQEFVSKVGLFQLVWVNGEEYWEPISKNFMDSLAVSYLNNCLERCQSASDAQALIRETLGDSSRVKTILFQGEPTRVFAFCGEVNELVYVALGSHSIFGGIFQSYGDMKFQFGDYVCQYKEESHPNMLVYTKRSSKVTFVETFGIKFPLASKKHKVQIWDTSSSAPCKMYANFPKKFLETGKIVFAEENENPPTYIEDVYDKLDQIPSVLFKTNLKKSQNWIIIVISKNRLFYIGLMIH